MKINTIIDFPSMKNGESKYTAVFDNPFASGTITFSLLFGRDDLMINGEDRDEYIKSIFEKRYHEWIKENSSFIDLEWLAEKYPFSVEQLRFIIMNELNLYTAGVSAELLQKKLNIAVKALKEINYFEDFAGKDMIKIAYKALSEIEGREDE